MSSARDAEKSSAAADVDVTHLKPALSSREQEILMAAWLSIKGPEPQVSSPWSSSHHSLAGTR